MPVRLRIRLFLQHFLSQADTCSLSVAQLMAWHRSVILCSHFARMGPLFPSIVLPSDCIFQLRNLAYLSSSYVSNCSFLFVFCCSHHPGRLRAQYHAWRTVATPLMRASKKWESPTALPWFTWVFAVFSLPRINSVWPPSSCCLVASMCSCLHLQTKIIIITER